MHVRICYNVYIHLHVNYVQSWDMWFSRWLPGWSGQRSICLSPIPRFEIFESSHNNTSCSKQNIWSWSTIIQHTWTLIWQALHKYAVKLKDRKTSLLLMRSEASRSIESVFGIGAFDIRMCPQNLEWRFGGRFYFRCYFFFSTFVSVQPLW